jgi:uncharacterized protein YjbI with pentapeptide repeats
MFILAGANLDNANLARDLLVDTNLVRVNLGQKIWGFENWFS